MSMLALDSPSTSSIQAQDWTMSPRAWCILVQVSSKQAVVEVLFRSLRHHRHLAGHRDVWDRRVVRIRPSLLQAVRERESRLVPVERVWRAS